MNEQGLFLDALEITSPEEREQFLRRACGDDSALRSRIETLLEEHFADDSLLGRLAVERDAMVGLGVELSEGPGTIVGRYKLLQKIGEGGMGVVYMAEQTAPVVRRVALKIIKLGMDTKQVIARFEAERQALAMMDHPNIAKVLDGGATETGRPYFVMELVQGVPITEFCDKNRLSIQQRLELFIPICQAVQSAHQKGVIHRDIKPSNVLVSLDYGEAAPKVIDFGIAKATNQKLTEKTLFTNYGQMIGTPAYMSPEQAEMSNLDVDTRTDVYSLGALLYELLTGAPPFSSKDLFSVGLLEMQRIIAEEEPVKPSTRVSTMEGERRSAIMKCHGVDPAGLGKLCRGDLDWITMKCLEKDRRRRYETANDLVSDLKRHLNSEPVSAAAPSVTYQFRKLYTKHKIVVRAVAAISTSLIVATVVSGYLAFRMDRLRQDADQLRGEAEAERNRAKSAEQEALSRSIDLENNLYVSDMLAVGDAVEKEEFSRAEQLLLQHRREPSGRDLRGFEWRFFWERARGEQLYSYQAHDGSTSSNSALRRSVNRSEILQIQIVGKGRQLITYGNDRKLKLWDLASKELVREWESRSRFALSPNERFLCFHEPEHGLSFWDLPANRLIRSGGPTEGNVVYVEFTYDSRYLVHSSAEYERGRLLKSVTTVEDVISGDVIFAPEGTWSDIAVSPTGPLILTIGSAGQLSDPSNSEPVAPNIEARFWNYERREVVHSPVASHGMGIRFSPSGNYVAISHSEDPGNINAHIDTNIYRVATGEKVSTLLGVDFGAWIYDPSTVSFSSGEEYIAAPNRPGSMTIGIWAITTGERIGSYTGHTSKVSAVAFHPLYDEILMSTSYDQTLQYWRWKDKQTIKRLTGQTGSITTLAVGDSGTPVITGGYDGSLFFWPPHNTTPVNRLPHAPSAVSVPIFSSQGSYLVLGERTAASPRLQRYMMVGPGAPPPNIRRSVFAAENSQWLWEIPRSEKALGFSPDELFLLTVTTNKVLYREAQTGSQVRSVILDPPLNSIDFERPVLPLLDLSSDASMIATLDAAKTLRLVSLITGEIIATFKTPVTHGTAGFSPSGEKVFFTSLDPLKSGVWDHSLNEIVWLEGGNQSWISGRAVSTSDEKIVAGRCFDGNVRIWRIATGELIRSIDGAKATGIHFTPDDRTLMLGHSARSITSRKVVTTIRLFNTRTWRQIAELQPPAYSHWVRGRLMSPDGQNLLSYNADGNIVLIRTPFTEEIEQSIQIRQGR